MAIKRFPISTCIFLAENKWGRCFPA